MAMTDKEIISHALSMWGNYIETGDVTLNGSDAVQRNKLKSIKFLDRDQLVLLGRIRQLQQEILIQ